jgi:hypothetical protein
MQSKFTFSGSNVTKQFTQQSIQPDEEDLRSFLLDFRQFISEDEPIYLSRIFNHCYLYLDNNELKNELIKAREEWKRLFIKMGAFQLVIDDQKITGEYILDLFLNGFYFHNDLKKLTELEGYIKNSDILILRMHLLFVLPGLTEIILFVGRVVNHGLQEGLFHIPKEES